MLTAETVVDDQTPNSELPRLDEHDAAAGDTADDFMHDAAFWYDNGNVILISSDHVGFRLYRGLLANQSTMFHDLFSLPQPPEAHNTPVIPISESSIAFKEVLAALFHGKSYSIENDIELDCLSYRIRVSYKYGFTALLEESLQELHRLYPSTLADWDKVPHHNSARAITVVNLARLTNTLSLLPSAVYSCCQIDEAVLLDGAVHPDGTVDVLSRDDLVICMKARTQLVRLRITYAVEVFRLFSECQPYTDCRGEVRAMYKDLTKPRADRVDEPAGLLGRWNDIVDARAPKICKQCLTHVRKSISHFRSLEWERMRSRMGMRDWAQALHSSEDV